MKYLQPSFTMPQAEPNPEMCCEACVFGSGEHAEWCVALTDEFVQDCVVSDQFVRTGRDEFFRAGIYRDDALFEARRSNLVGPDGALRYEPLVEELKRQAWNAHRGTRPILEPLGSVASDCQFCSDIDYDAVGYLPGCPDLPGAICARCLENLSAGREYGDNS
jgi:hypothetical protein